MQESRSQDGLSWSQLAQPLGFAILLLGDTPGTSRGSRPDSALRQLHEAETLLWKVEPWGSAISDCPPSNSDRVLARGSGRLELPKTSPGAGEGMSMVLRPLPLEQEKAGPQETIFFTQLRTT